MNYLPLFQDEDFDNVLGDGAAEEVMQVLGPRFNMDGGPIPGRKVGLMDLYQLWCFICDPFSHRFRNMFRFECEGGLHHLTTLMIAHFVPATSEEGYEITRKAVRDDFEVCFVFYYPL